MVGMSLSYITEGSLPITKQKIDPASGTMATTLLVRGSHWQPSVLCEVWRENKFELVSSCCHMFMVVNFCGVVSFVILVTFRQHCLEYKAIFQSAETQCHFLKK